jgi:radical SAM superfamily enzyme YgiQ (UPF0313 family)
VSTIWSRRIRYRSVGSVMAEIGWLHEQWGTDFFSFRDASFTLDRERVTALCARILAEGLDIGWECTTRADLLDEDLWRLLQQAGCRNIRLGVESGSPRVLRTMGKNLDLDKVRDAARLLNRHGAYWSAYFLFGTPHETVASIEETMAFIREIDPPFVTVARYTPLPGSAMHAELEKAGRIAVDDDWGREGNQSLGVCYASAIGPPEFERLMGDVADEFERRNAANAARLGHGDPRVTT